MDFEWTVSRVFSDIPEREYINDCCIGGDEILAQIKPEIARLMNIDVSLIEIYQEDWGWALEFAKDDVFYFLGIGKTAELESETLFTVNLETHRNIKGFLLNKKVEAAEELKILGKLLSEIAESLNF
nr:hypothetical protein [Pyrinomonadaceae bacterium]